MLKHNVYFEGQVQSIGFERNVRRQTAVVSTNANDVVDLRARVTRP